MILLSPFQHRWFYEFQIYYTQCFFRKCHQSPSLMLIQEVSQKSWYHTNFLNNRLSCKSFIFWILTISLINCAYSQTLLFLHLCSSPKLNSKHEEQNIFHLLFFFFLPLFQLYLLSDHDLSIVLSLVRPLTPAFALLSFYFLTTSLVIYMVHLLFLSFYFLVSISALAVLFSGSSAQIFCSISLF